MAGTLPLEIAPSLRLVLVGDSGVGKSQSRSLFLNSVPGQVDAAQPVDSPDISALAINDTTEDDAPNGAANGATNGTTNGASNGANGKANGHGDKYLHKDAVSTLEIPSWLSVSSPTAIDGETARDMVPAENIVLHDFVGYGQALDARQTIDRVDSFLTEQYVATRGLFGPSITPASTSNQESQPQLGSFLEQLLVDSTMAHSLPDACLYFVLYDLKPVDINFMKRIMNKVNLIPVLAKADTLTTNQVWKAKAKILKQLQENEISFFQFGFTIEDLKEMAAEKISGGPPFALSTSELETQQLGAPAASLTDLANSINQGQFADSHSDLCLLQTLLLGSKNRMLHQASVKKFMNRWRSDLGLPIEEETPVVIAHVQGQNEPVDASASQDHQQEQAQEQQQHDTEQPEQQQQQQQQQEEGQFYQQEQEQEQQYHQQQVEQVQPQQSQQQQYTQQQPAQQQQQTTLPPILQPLPYQPSSTYIPYNSQSSLSPKAQDEEVAQVYKLNRAQSVIRSASPSAKIFTHGGIVPALPTTTYNASSSATSPGPMSPNA